MEVQNIIVTEKVYSVIPTVIGVLTGTISKKLNI